MLWQKPEATAASCRQKAEENIQEVTVNLAAAKKEISMGAAAVAVVSEWMAFSY